MATEPDMIDDSFLPTRSRSTALIVGCIVGSFVLHGVAYGVLEEIDRPAVRRRTSEDIIRHRPAPRPRAHQVKLQKRKAPVPRRPAPRSVPRRVVVAKFRPMAPPPMAALQPPRPAARPVIDLTMGAGVNASLTSGAGDFEVQVGDTALGDPTVAPMRTPPPMRPAPPMDAPPPPPPMRARPVPVYVKVMPQAVSVPQVPYPAAARRQQVEGTVTLEVTVGSDGRVIRVKVVRGIGYGLDEAATRALRSARFKPAMGSDGRPMAYTIRYRYTFRIER